MRAVIFDIDGTLSDPTHRLHHVTNGARNWDAFFAAMGDDPCHNDIADLAWCLLQEPNVAVICCSGRPDSYREQTETWLNKYCINCDALYMRPAGDYRPDTVIKRELLDRIRKDGFDPWLVIDDRPSVVAMWRAEGLTCLQCRDWNERAPTTTKPTTLTLMVGPSGAGKTTWLSQIDKETVDKQFYPLEVIIVGDIKWPRDEYGIDPTHIISTDQLRRDLCGNQEDQSQNDAVFAALHALVKTRLDHGLPTVVDATNLHRRDRRAITDLQRPGSPIRYIVIDRPLEEKLRDRGWRSEELVRRHHERMRSVLKDVLAGDDMHNVEVVDLRRT